jgi:hypothetical protein
MTTYRSQERLRSHHCIWRWLNVNRLDLIDHLSQIHLTDHLQPFPICKRHALGIASQDQDVPVLVSLKEEVLSDIGNGCCPERLLVACYFRELAWETHAPWSVF